MVVKYPIAAFLTFLILQSCNKEYNCSYVQIQPAFIGFTASDIDTFVFRKFKQNDNFQNLIDTFVVKDGDYSLYQTTNDTTTVFVSDATNDGMAGIKPGFDWQIFIPAKNKTVFISGIISEKKTGKCGNLDKMGCTCTNENFSLKNDNQTINFSNSPADTGRYFIYIRN